MSKALYRVTLKPTDAWSKCTHTKLKPMYVVEDSKKGARSYAERHLKAGLSIKSVSFLGEQLGMSMYSGGKDA